MRSFHPSPFASIAWLPLGALLAACAPNSDPIPVFAGGKIIEIQNCSPPSESNRLLCMTLICEKALYDRALLPPGANVVQWTKYYNRSDDPTRTTHTAKYADASTFRYAACEMRDLRVESAHEVIPLGRDR
jgi:hypothetical protein